MAAYERHPIRRRTMAGAARSLLSDGRPKTFPLGYAWDPTRAVVAHETEAPLVREMFSLLAAGHSASSVRSMLATGSLTRLRP